MMHPEDPESKSAEERGSERLDPGLRAAFGPQGETVAAPISVIQALGGRAAVTTCQLREPEDDMNPIERPRGPDTEGIPERTGPFQVFGELGHGGMGVVLKGRDVDLFREVALKFLLKKHSGSPDMVGKFIEEAQIMGQLQHPGIAPLHRLGLLPDGQPYFAMKLIKGRTLTASLEARKDPSEERPRFIGIFHQVCQTVAYAHARYVIHRDLKPANIMVGTFGEVQVMDWGLAKVLSRKVTLVEDGGKGSIGITEVHTTREPGSGSLQGGTPEYMAPEQARAEDDLDERCDVFGLGAILCEILTGRPPYIDGNPKETLHKAKEADLADALGRLDRCGADPELIAIARRCLSAPRAERFRDAGFVAKEVGRYLTALEERALAAQVAAEKAKVERTASVRIARRTRILGSAVAVACFVVIAILFVHARSVIHARNEAIAQEKETKESLERSNQLQSKLFLEKSDRSLKDCSYQEAALFAAAAYNLVGAPEARGNLAVARHRLPKLPVWTTTCGVDTRAAIFSPDEKYFVTGQIAVWDMETGKELFHLEGHNDQVNSLCFSPDGNMLASASDDERVMVWDFHKRERKLKLDGHSGPVLAVCFSPDGKRIASGSEDRTVKVWDAGSGEVLRSLEGNAAVRCVAFGPRGDFLASGSADGKMLMWDARTFQEVGTASGPSGINSCVFLPAGNRIATAHEDGVIRIWEIPAMKVLQELNGHTAEVRSLSAGPDGPLVSGSKDKGIVLWNPNDASQIARFEAGAPIRSVSVSPTERWIVSTDEDQRIRLWDVRKKKEAASLEGHTGFINLIAFNPDGTILASSSYDRSVRLWDVTTGKEIARLDHQKSVSGVTFSPKDKLLATTEKWEKWEEGTIRIWDLGANKEIGKLQGKKVKSTSASFSPDGTTIAAGCEDNTIGLWSVATRAEIGQLAGHTEFVPAVAFTPDGKRLASISYDRTIRIWDIKDRKEVMKLEGHTGWILYFALSNDGNRLASVDRDGKTRIWDLTIGKQIEQFEGGNGFLEDSLAFSMDDRFLAIPYGECVRFWDFAAGREIIRLSTAVSGVAFSPEGKWIACGGCDNSIHLLDVQEITNPKLPRLKGHEEWIMSVAFSPDGSLIASGSTDKTVRVWNILRTRQELVLKGHEKDINCITFSPQGSIASCSEDNTIRLWDSKTGADLGRLEGHKDGVKCGAFSTDGKVFISGGGDHKVILWDIDSRTPLKTLDKHNGSVRAITFSPDGKQFATGSADKTIRLWDLRTGSEINILRGQAYIRGLTYSPKGNLIACGSTTGQTRLWEFGPNPKSFILESRSPDIGPLGNVRFLASSAPLHFVIQAQACPRKCYPGAVEFRAQGGNCPGSMGRTEWIDGHS